MSETTKDTQESPIWYSTPPWTTKGSRIIDNDGQEVCRLPISWPCEGDHEAWGHTAEDCSKMDANAPLIAAAPDLLHSLVSCIKILQEHMGTATPGAEKLKCEQCSPKFEEALSLVTALQKEGIES